MTDLDFIEIGPCDFETHYEKSEGQKGLVIEPVRCYYDKIPSSFFKLNAAISDEIGWEDILWVSPEDAAAHNLPRWLRGCSSIENPTETMQQTLQRHNLMHLLSKKLVPVYTIAAVSKMFCIQSCKFLLIDTEGLDSRIIVKMVNDYLDGELSFLPDRIQYECNALTSDSCCQRANEHLKSVGYEEESFIGNNFVYRKVR